MAVEIPRANETDVHGLEYADTADLNVFFAGNQSPVVPELLENFREEHPEAGQVFYETLPPGLLAEQIRAGGATFGGREITARADVYLSTTIDLMRGLAREGFLEETEIKPYVKNRLVLVVAGGNPKGIRGLEDLTRDDVRISMPNPEREGIARYILDMYRDFGGPEFERKVMEEKKEAGATTLTAVHHRETPDNLEQGKADVGPVWFTEYKEHAAKDRDIELIEVGREYDQQDEITYYLAPLKEAPHPDLARKFVDFVLNPGGQEVYARYGFVPAAPER
ncbi:MAG: substrate-binding domain-containing protein [Rubrobacteraceae bacterium]